MKRPLPIWLTFLLFLALSLGAMAWMTRTVLRLDQAQARATAAAQIEENVRLALWRMDYAMAPILGQETARPYFEYSPVFPAERAYTRMYTELKSGDVLVPSPLLKSTSPYILLYFQIDPDGKVTSPQAPTGNVRKIAEARYTSAADIERAQKRVADVAALVKDPTLLATLPAPRDPEIWNNNKIRVLNNGTVSNDNSTLSLRDNGQQQLQQAPAQSLNSNRRGGGDTNNYNAPNAPANTYDLQQQAAIQQKRGQQEYVARQQTQVENNDLLFGNNSGNYIAPGVSFSVMRPLWAGVDTLLLARQVSINGRTYVQGCLLDWPAIRKWLLDSAGDLLPQADLLPVHSETDDKQPRMLASIPVRLMLPAESTVEAASMLSPAGFFATPNSVTLLIAWIAVLLACAAVGILLRGVIALSQRRAGFVAAVTHELRTPLTTLRMYTEMLADGMVADPAQQAAYHKTLRAESNRLGHLVDNVLLYSRLERSTRDTRVESTPLASLLERLTPRLADRASQAGMSLRIQIASAARDVAIRANALSVEQILFNLVDNACKYAADARERTIDLSVYRLNDRIEIRLADHGPGLDPTSRARLFKPFSKSVHEAANSAPGLGLGLALSHRLAKNMNADLRLDPTPKDGAVFILTLPIS
ncbi:MAG: histidine kinase [Phycisphaerales bacterium]|nr:histidine kinase [Phycisphaerales bacterium]